MHYDERKDLLLTCDASPYGVGAVLSHLNSNGIDSPIAYYSRTLTSTERNYAQIDREALAIVAGVKKFHNYLYGRYFNIRTDHRPLLGIIGNNKQTPEILSPRMLRWSIILSAYSYTLTYHPGKSIANADALSRLPLTSPEVDIPAAPEVLMLECSPEVPLSSKMIAKLSIRDPLLSRVLNFALKGWPDKLPDEFKPYWVRRNEISTYKDCVLWGNRVIVPTGGRKEILKLLHATHPGVVKMKALARSYVWWPGIDKEIEDVVGTCETCQVTRHAPAKAPVHPWEWSREPWVRLHIDFAGPFKGQIFFIVVDSYSKWLEVRHVPTTSALSAITVLRELFATHGLPDVLVSDNGSAFTSEEFAKFMKHNQIRHTTIAPYHASTNGQAERFVQTTKEGLSKLTDGDWKTKLARFLLHQHVTPCSATGRSPAELLMGRRLKTILDRLHPDFEKEDKRFSNVQSKPVRTFTAGEPVYARNYGIGPKWVPAEIQEATGPVSYRTLTTDGEVLRRHVDQVRQRHEMETNDTNITVNNPDVEPERVIPNSTVDTTQQSSSGEISSKQDEINHRPSRLRRPPAFLRDYVTN